MESVEDKHWAQRALIDPLNEPEPSAEDGPGTHFRPPPSSAASTTSTTRSPPSSSSKLQKNNPFRKSSSASKNPFISERELGRSKSDESQKAAYPSPPQSASPRRDQFSPRQQASGRYRDTPLSPTNNGASSGRRRGNSLNERYPGDTSVRPLETLKKEEKSAYRAPHLRKHHQIRPDPIDSLDVVGGKYHHEGPFDAAYYARNTSFRNSPLEALSASNEEALKATANEKILDSVERHRPLDGVAAYAPGETDRMGRVYNYEPGENMMIEGNPAGGAYKRWPGMQYHPDDIKGKGEPSYTIEKSLKDHHSSSHRREMADGIEMTSRPKSSGYDRDEIAESMWGEGDVPSGSIGRSNTTGRDKRLSGGGIKRRFGSIRRSLGGHKDE